MESVIKLLLLSCASILGGTVLAFWIAGTATEQQMLQVMIGVLLVTPLVFVVSMLLKMPFVGFKKSLLAFCLIVLVALCVIEALGPLQQVRETGSLSQVLNISPWFLLCSIGIGFLAIFSS